MRDSLTVLAILVIAVLTAALVGPYLVDWNSQRALIEAKLSEAAGVPVAVAGRIDLKILPRPIFRFWAVTIGDPAPGHPHLTAEAARAEISLTALMRGRIEVVQTTLWAPRLDLEEGPDGGFGLPSPSPATADRIAVQNLRIQHGTLAVALADGHRVSLKEVDLDAEATTLRGPFKATGRFGAGADAVPFRLASGVAERDRMEVHLQVERGALRPALDLDGVLRRSVPGGPAKTPVRAGAPVASLGFEGRVALEAELGLANTPATVPWRFSGHLVAGLDAAALSDAELRAGTDMRALIADGQGTAHYGAGGAIPDVTLKLHGAGLDFDALAVAPGNSDIAAPRGPELMQRLFDLATHDGSSVTSPTHITVEADFDTSTLAGQTLLGTHARLALGPEPQASVALSLSGPDGGRLALDGRFEPGPAAVFRGHADLESGDLRRTAGLFSPAWPSLTTMAEAVPARSVAVSGDVEASGVGIAARNLAVRLDRSQLAGTLTFTRAVGTERSRLFADLRAPSLDLDALPDLSRAAAATRGLDLSLSLAAQTARLSEAALVPGQLGVFDASALTLKLTRGGDDVKLDRLALDLEGASVEVSGSMSPSAARAEARVRTTRFDAVAAILRRLVPGAATTLLARNAESLSPFEGTLSAEARVAAAGAGLVPTHLALEGRTAGTTFAATLVPDRPDDDRDPAGRPLTLSLKADAPEATVPLHLLGATGTGALGALHLEGVAHGSVATGFDAHAQATVAGVALRYVGTLGTTPGPGHLDVRTPDLDPLLAALGWTSATLPATPLPGEAGAELSTSGTTLKLDRLAARVGGRSVAGDLALDLSPRKPGEGTSAARPLLAGHLAIDTLAVEDLLNLGMGGSPVAQATEGTRPTRAFAGPLGPPSSDIALTVQSMPLAFGLVGDAVRFTMRTGGGAMTLADLVGHLRGGTVEGGLSLRRDGPTVALSGRMALNGVPLEVDGLSGRIGGALDFAGSGDAPAALVASLGGSGNLTLANAVLAATDPQGPLRTAAALAKREDAADQAAAPLDADTIRRDLAAEIGRAALSLGDQASPLTLAAGTLRAGPFRVRSSEPDPASPNATGRWEAETRVALDLPALTASIRTRLRPFLDPRAPEAPGGEVVVVRSGPLGETARVEVDGADFVNLTQARSIARAQERIDTFEQDVRERAFFNRQLKAIEADQQAARDRAKAAAEAAKAAAEVHRADALRQKGEDARLQAEVEAAARADASRAASKAEAEKQQFFEDALKGAADPYGRPRAESASPGPSGSPPSVHRPSARGPRASRGAPLDLGPLRSSSRDRSSAPAPVDPATAGQY